MEDESAAAGRGEAARGRGRVMDGSAAVVREGRGSHGERRAVNESTARGGKGRMGMNESGAVVRGGVFGSLEWGRKSSGLPRRFSLVKGNWFSQVRFQGFSTNATNI